MSAARLRTARPRGPASEPATLGPTRRRRAIVESCGTQSAASIDAIRRSSVHRRREVRPSRAARRQCWR
jgi:hypothetical protein